MGKPKKIGQTVQWELERLQKIANSTTTSSDSGYDCEVCRDTGYEIIEQGGRTAARLCRCRQQLPADKPLRFYFNNNIAREFPEVGLADYDTRWGQDEKTREKLKQFKSIVTKYVDNYDKAARAGKGFYFNGDVGSGKTFLAACVISEIARRYNVPTQAFEVSPLISALRKAELSNEEQSKDLERRIWAALEKSHALLLDDIGTEKSTEYTREIIHRVVQYRKAAGLITFYTSNHLLSKLQLERRDISRIDAVSIQVRFPEINVRLLKRNKSRDEFLKELGVKNEQQ